MVCVWHCAWTWSERLETWHSSSRGHCVAAHWLLVQNTKGLLRFRVRVRESAPVCISIECTYHSPFLWKERRGWGRLLCHRSVPWGTHGILKRRHADNITTVQAISCALPSRWQEGAFRVLLYGPSFSISEFSFSLPSTHIQQQCWRCN